MRPLNLSLPFEEPHLRFIVHEHQATRHHFDLRLEFGPILLDFVLPDGPSLDPGVARFAKQCRHHLKHCLWLEARISEGSALIAWDMGDYAPRCPNGMSHEEAILRGIILGELELTFYGSKLKGSWILRRCRRHWRFTKCPDEFASTVDVRLQDRSVLTGRRLIDL